MTVVTGEHSDLLYGAKGDKKCNICNETLDCYPFLLWEADAVDAVDILLCTKCCRKMKRGFTADMIQVAAISELQALGYRDTLIRKNVRELEGKEADERKAWEAAERMHRFESTPEREKAAGQLLRNEAIKKTNGGFESTN